MATTTELAVSGADFDAKVLKSDVPVLVDFWAEWCGPCKAIGPSVEQLAQEYAGKAKVFKLDVRLRPEHRQHLRRDEHSRSSRFQRRQSCRPNGRSSSEGHDRPVDRPSAVGLVSRDSVEF